MFPSEVNTRDLYFSNPIDHFLGPDLEVKTSFESGFSSSYSGYNRPSGSREMQYKNTQELFSQTQKSEIQDSQFGTCNMDYQKYITQNLLLGNGDCSPKSTISGRQKLSEKVKEKTSAFLQNDNSATMLKEIKVSINILSDCIKRMDSEVASQTNCVKTIENEMAILHKEVSSTEKVLEDKVQQMSENFRQTSTVNRKETEDIKMIYDIIKKLPAQEMYTFNKPNQNNLEVWESKHQPQQLVQDRIWDSRRQVLVNSNYGGPPRITPQATNVHCQNNNMTFENVRERAYSKAPVQTPIAQYMEDVFSEPKSKPKKYTTRSSTKAKKENCKNNTQYTNIKVKRKVTTPTLKSPAGIKVVQTTRNFCTPLIDSLKRARFHNQGNYTGPQIRLQPQYREANSTFNESANNSSPGLTVYQATTLAREYAVHMKKMPKEGFGHV